MAVINIAIVIIEVRSLRTGSTLTELKPTVPVADRVTTVFEGNFNRGNVVFDEFFVHRLRIDGKVRSSSATHLFDKDVVNIVLGNGCTGRRIEVHSAKLTRTSRTISLQTECPRSDFLIINREAGHVVVEVKVVFHIEPSIVRALEVGGNTASFDGSAV